MALLVVRAGRDCEDAPGNLANNQVSLAFDEPDASACASYEDVLKLVQAKQDPGKKAATLRQWAGSLWNLRTPEHDQAIVVMPVNQDGKRAYAIGRVTGGYYFDATGTDRHRRPVQWLHKGIPSEVIGRDVRVHLGPPSSCFKISNPHAMKRLLALADGKPLPGSPEEDIALGRVTDTARDVEVSEYPFPPKAFELLALLEASPKAETYNSIKDELTSTLTERMQQLVGAVIESLPEPILASEETEKSLFSKFLKNDYGQGGAWPYLWAAIYNKGSSRVTSAQLFLHVDHHQVRYGFYIGDNAGGIRQRFRANAFKYRTELLALLTPWYEGTDLTFGVSADEQPTTTTFKDWLAKSDQYGYRACVIVDAPTAALMTGDQWQDTVRAWWSMLYPLVLLANHDNPLPMIRDYVEQAKVGAWVDEGEHTDRKPVELPRDEIAPKRQPHPMLPLGEVAAQTGMPEATLASWIAAINRKGQAILAGPPGTGKTYCARWLAAHLVGGGDGVVDIVQFHPAYTYEDFIEGIRPQSKPGGFPEYPVVPGRFLRFLADAETRTGTSVLIIDEINRANLAQVFGELMYLLEYRHGVAGPEAAPAKLKLANGGEISIPTKVVLLGTMNTADRSIALVDHALRRRFAVLPLHPEYGILVTACAKNGREPLGTALRQILDEVNRAIDDRHYHLGISFFLGVATAEQPLDLLASVWAMEIEPYLDEFFADQPETAKKFAWSQIKGRFPG